MCCRQTADEPPEASCTCLLGLQEKLGLPPDQQHEVVNEMVKAYVEGLCWVMHYYYEGECPESPPQVECLLRA